MEVDVDKTKELIKLKFHDNISYFAEEIGVNREYVSAILNGRKTKESPKVCNAIIKYCELNNLNYKEYVKIT